MSPAEGREGGGGPASRRRARRLSSSLLRALGASASTFLGPSRGLKAVIEHDTGAGALVGDVGELLGEVEVHHPALAVLREAAEALATEAGPGGGIAPSAGPGSGAAWMVALAGELAGERCRAVGAVRAGWLGGRHCVGRLYYFRPVPRLSDRPRGIHLRSERPHPPPSPPHLPRRSDSRSLFLFFFLLPSAPCFWCVCLVHPLQASRAASRTTAFPGIAS